MSRQLLRAKFKDLSLSDPFFDSLKSDYKSDFVGWFERKGEEDLYIVHDGTVLSGMIYLKREIGAVNDVSPSLPARTWLKVGTFKLDRRGTRLGERVVKKIFDTAIAEAVDGIYVTVFQMHEHLIAMFKRYGFIEWGTKTTKNGVEIVLTRDLRSFTGDIIKDYPFVHIKNKNYWLLAIKPPYHSRLLPDSILKNEPLEIVQDVSHTNTIHKAYIARISFSRLKRGDSIIFYRTKDRNPARYRSVATSVCVVEEIKVKRDFANVEDFLTYSNPRSVFSEEELRSEYNGRSMLSVAKMTYNAAFNRRLTRGTLIDEVGVRGSYWNLLQLTQSQFEHIIQLGDVNARLIID